MTASKKLSFHNSGSTKRKLRWMVQDEINASLLKHVDAWLLRDINLSIETEAAEHIWNNVVIHLFIDLENSTTV